MKHFHAPHPFFYDIYKPKFGEHCSGGTPDASISAARRFQTSETEVEARIFTVLERPARTDGESERSN